MMLFKSLVSVFAALAAVSTVAAAPPTNGSGNNGSGNNGSGNNGGNNAGHAVVNSAAAAATTPVHGSGNSGDGNNGGYASPPNPTTVNTCEGGSIVCCDIFTTGQAAGSAVTNYLGSLPPLTTYVGLTCTSIVGNQW